MSWKRFYVYQYINEDGSPFYIGKGSNNRINESHSPWITIPAPEYRTIVKDNLTEKEAFDLEINLIKLYGRKQDGGILENKKISRWVAQAGWHHSSKTKEKISLALTGKKKSEEQKQHYKGTKTAEHAEKVRQAVQRMWDDPVYREQRLAKLKEKPFAHKGKPWSSARREAQMKNKIITENSNGRMA